MKLCSIGVIFINILQVITGNDNGGGGNHVINICLNNISEMKCSLCLIGDGALYEKAKELKIPVTYYSFKELLCGKLIEHIEKNKIDIINFHGAKANFLYFMIAHKIKAPCVVTIHSDYRYDFINSKLKKIFFTPLSILGLKKYKNYICVSQHLKNLISKNNFKGNKYVIPNGISLEKVSLKQDRNSIRNMYNISKNEFLYSMVGRMHPIKNHEGLIDAFFKLQIEIKDVKLMLLGFGDLEERLKEKVEKLNIQDKVIFTGFKEDILDYINASDIGVLTSFSEGGAPPLAVLETALMRKTIICSKVGDMESIISENDGFLVNPYDVNDIYDKIRYAYMNRYKLELMGENLYNKVKHEFSLDNFWRRYFEVYSKILSGVN